MSTTEVFRTREKVEAVEDLPGVPAGTKGRVLTIAGVTTWVRYFVQFENGVELSGVSGHQLGRVAKR